LCTEDDGTKFALKEVDIEGFEEEDLESAKQEAIKLGRLTSD
jgi:hypothetical protein